MSRDRKGASRRGNRPAIIRGELHPSGRVASHRAPRGPFNPMADKIIVPDINSWLEDELRAQYHHDRRAVDESWKDVFESGGNGAPPASQMIPAAPPSAPISKQIAAAAVAVGPTERSEERRVGKEGGSGWAALDSTKKCGVGGGRL